MKISEKARIWVYGYGVRGRFIKEKLQNAGCFVYGYIDQNPERYEEDRKDNLIIKLCDANPIPEDIVICSVTNVFVHAAIAKQLSDQGFHHIIYKCFKKSEAAKHVNDLYDDLTNTYNVTKIKGRSVPSYFETCREEKSIFQNEKYVCVNIPVELLFGLTTDFFIKSLKDKKPALISAIPGKSILYYTLPKHMMQYFSGEIEEDTWGKCKYLWYDSRNSQTYSDTLYNSLDETNQIQNIKDRYTIYQEMEKLFNDDISFFSENPISVVWNENGWFNIQDGNNRAAFLLAKGVYNIPSRMSREDYDVWLDVKPAVEQVKKAQKLIKEQMKAPILHPLFKDVLFPMETYYHRKIAALCDWLWRKELKPEHLRVCEYCCENDLCGSHFSRMGSELVVYDTEEQVVLHKALDSLYRLQNVSYLDKDNIFDEVFDIILCNSAFLLTTIIQNNIKSEWYVLEYIDKSDLEIKESIEKNGLILSEYLIKTLVGNQIYKVIIARGR